MGNSIDKTPLSVNDEVGMIFSQKGIPDFNPVWGLVLKIKGKM
jgi:hypothetical protein